MPIHGKLVPYKQFLESALTLTSMLPPPSGTK
jgi:hypothetical protein